MSQILNSNFKYVPALKTDVRKTMDRVRRQQQKAKDVSDECAGWFDESAFALSANVRTFKRQA